VPGGAFPDRYPPPPPPILSPSSLVVLYLVSHERDCVPARPIFSLGILRLSSLGVGGCRSSKPELTGLEQRVLRRLPLYEPFAKGFISMHDEHCMRLWHDKLNTSPPFNSAFFKGRSI